MKPLPAGAWLAGAVLLGLLTLALGTMAFTRFDQGEPPPAGSPEVEEWNDRAYDDARVSSWFGIAAAFTLLGTFACGQRWALRKSQQRIGR